MRDIGFDPNREVPKFDDFDWEDLDGPGHSGPAPKPTFARLFARLFGCEEYHDLFERGWQVEQDNFVDWPLHHRIWFYLQSPNDLREEVACQVAFLTGIHAAGPDSYREIFWKVFREGVIGWRCSDCRHWKHQQRRLGRCDACYAAALKKYGWKEMLRACRAKEVLS